jgi:8-oxo-dGTP pyrophosphatase MutT (NUDIX family)
LQDGAGRYLFFLAGTRHLCPPGELFYAGIGGHREPGEDWVACAHREAREEVGSDVDILSAAGTWYVPRQDRPRQVAVEDDPRPFMLYEMVHPPGTPRAGRLYRIVIYLARLHDRPQSLPPDEVQGIVALTPAQVRQSLHRKPALATLLDEGATLVAGAVAAQTRLYPLGTARALARVGLEIPGLSETRVSERP